LASAPESVDLRSFVLERSGPLPGSDPGGTVLRPHLRSQFL